jgi:16S rRNA (cytidine1402-2'-O)-methyltransferase
VSNLAQKGTLYIVATPIGNLSDISERAKAILSSVDLVAAEDTRHTKRLLQHLGINCRLLALHEHNEDEKSALVADRLAAGESVALVSDAGTPLISDPGFPLVRDCHQRSIPVSPIPGSSALIAALSASGLATDEFHFIGFVPRKSNARREVFSEKATASGTWLFYESSHRIIESLRDLAAIIGDLRRVVLARELTKLHETIISAPLAELLDQVIADENQQKGEFVVIVEGAAQKEKSEDFSDVDRILRILMADLPLKQAASFTSEITGVKKNIVYQRGLALKG